MGEMTVCFEQVRVDKEVVIVVVIVVGASSVSSISFSSSSLSFTRLVSGSESPKKKADTRLDI